MKDRGSLHLYIQYSSDSQALVISVVSAKNLPTHGQYEVYVKWLVTNHNHTEAYSHSVPALILFNCGAALHFSCSVIIIN